jgi:SAM-dependent methyltransferase
VRPVDLVGRLRRFIRGLRFRWNASAHYHAWLLSQVPSEARTALDVGCGDGRFTRRLADRGLEVDAIDRDAAMLGAARGGPPSRIHWIHGDVLDPTMPLRARGYDVVVVIAALHLMTSQHALARLRTLVGDNGSLLIIGLYRAEGVYDSIVSLLVLPLHLVIGAYRSRVYDALVRYDPNVPVGAPREGLRDVRAAAAAALPGARVRRRAFWRYTLLWRAQTFP